MARRWSLTSFIGRFVTLAFVLAVSVLSVGCLSSDGEAVDSLFGDDSSDGVNTGPGKDAFDSSPTTHDFGSVAAGQTSSTVAFTLTNTHSEPVYISSVAISNSNFELVSETCPNSPTGIGASAGCTVTARFSPQTAGSLSAVIEIIYGTSSATSTSLSDTVVLAGTGVADLTFSGLETITPVTHNTMQLNWTANSDATAFQVFQIVSGSMVYNSTVTNTGGTVDSTTVTGLTPLTSYTFRVRGIDGLGNPENNTSDVTASTDPNTNPSMAAIANPSVYGGTPAADVDAYDSNTSGDTDADGDALTYTCRYDNTIDATVGVGLGTCASLTNEGGGNPSFSSSTGTLSGWTPQFAQTGTAFEFEIVATDPYGGTDSVIFSTTVQPGVPILSDPSDLLFPSSEVTQGSAVNLNFDNTRSSPASDTGMTYTCEFDRVVDGSVSSGANCTTLPGASPSFPNSDGAINWTPNSEAWGAYEIKMTGTNTAGSDTEIVIINVAAPVLQTNLLYYFDAQFATTSSTAGTNSPLTSSWTDLLTSLGSLTASLANFAGTSSSGWAGELPNGASTAHQDPHRVVMDGSDDEIDFGTIVNSQGDLTADLWATSADVTTGNRVVMGNGDSSDQGFNLRSSPDNTGRITLHIGSAAYAQEVLADDPVLYLRLNEGTPTALQNAGSGIVTATPSGVTMNNASALDGDADTSGYFGGSASISLGTPAALQITGDQTIEMWVKPTAFGTRRNPYAKAYGGEGTITQETNGTLNYYYGTAGGNASPYQGFTTGGPLTLNSWNHIVLVRDLSGTNKLYWYINGALSSSATATYGSAAVSGLTAYIGEGYVSRYIGYIDEVAIYNSALTAARVAAHYSAASVPTCTSKTAMMQDKWYHLGVMFDDASDIFKLYVDGVEECSIANTTALNTSSNNLKIGIDASSASDTAWNGGIGEARFYSGASSAAITTNFDATNERYHGINTLPPGLVSNMSFWAKADTVRARNNDSIYVWEDSSVNGNNLQQLTAASQPIFIENALNSYPAVRFDGNNDFMSASLGALSAPLTIFTVAKFANTNQPASDYDYVFNLGSNGGGVDSMLSLSRFASGGSADAYYSYNDSSALTGDALTGAQYSVFRQMFNSTAPYHQAWQNGVSLNAADSAGAVSTSGELNIGRWVTGTHFLNGDVVEIIIFNDALGTSNAEAVEEYLNNKYGL